MWSPGRTWGDSKQTYPPSNLFKHPESGRPGSPPPSLRPWKMPPLGGIHKLPAFIGPLARPGAFGETRERPTGRPCGLIQLPRGGGFILLSNCPASAWIQKV